MAREKKRDDHTAKIRRAFDGGDGEGGISRRDNKMFFIIYCFNANERYYAHVLVSRWHPTTHGEPWRLRMPATQVVEL